MAEEDETANAAGNALLPPAEDVSVLTEDEVTVATAVTTGGKRRNGRLKPKGDVPRRLKVRGDDKDEENRKDEIPESDDEAIMDAIAMSKVKRVAV